MTPAGPVLLLGTVLLTGCLFDPGGEDCGPWPDWSTSPYSLPYPQGPGWEVNQANCSGKGHTGFWRYGYDFSMPIGTVITASRGGTVIVSVGHCRDGDGSCTNQVAIRHPDGTAMVYSHLTADGALVEVGAQVQVGDTIARSGNTGYTGGFPHLHHSLHPCAEVSEPAGSCPSIPLTFSNTDPNPRGLVAKRTYPAR